MQTLGDGNAPVDLRFLRVFTAAIYSQHPIVLGSFLAFPSNRVGTLKASGMLHEKSRGAMFPFDGNYRSPFGRVGFAVAIGIAYFMAAELGLALRAESGTSVFWPAAGISVGVLIVWGPRARLPVAAGVIVATIVSNVTIGRNPWLACAFGVVNAGQVLLTTGLIERWFEEIIQAGGCAAGTWIFDGERDWSVGCCYGRGNRCRPDPTNSIPLHCVADLVCFLSAGHCHSRPLLVGISEAVRQLPPRRELVDGVVGILMLAALSAFVISLPQGPWSTALPVALVFPVLLWVIVRCWPCSPPQQRSLLL